MADPLSVLLGQKKEVEATQAKQKQLPKVSSTLATDPDEIFARSPREEPLTRTPELSKSESPRPSSNRSQAQSKLFASDDVANDAAKGAADAISTVVGAAWAAGAMASSAAADIIRTHGGTVGNHALGGSSAGSYVSSLEGKSNPAPTRSSSGSPRIQTTFDDQLAGEEVRVEVRNCYLKVSNPFCELNGRLLATNYRLKFQTPAGKLRQELVWMREAGYFDIPMGAIEEFNDSNQTTNTGAIEFKMTVQTKDLRQLVFYLPTDSDVRKTCDAINLYSRPGVVNNLFACKYCEALRQSGAFDMDVNGWRLYDPVQEYARMGIETELIPNPESPWQLSKLNNEYRLCPSYPASLVLPRKMNDNAIRAVAAFRKRGRLPAMSWCGGREFGYASLWRCSQTTEGLIGQKCLEDIHMVDCIRQGNPSRSSRDLLVVDLRPWKMAWANKAGGGGFESYTGCKTVFGGIDNIHAVRSGWKQMGAAVANSSDSEVGSWFKDVAASQWYDYIGAIMNSTKKVVKEIVDNRSNVMVHCSDGWDRTAQATSLSMICLDPHYRSQAGFLLLVQKEWCSFGHKFRTRLALGEQPSSEYSPVFIQWLECVYQIVAQRPNDFEFTTDVLLRLADDVFSNKFGTFLCDSEREREAKAARSTVSLWSVLLSSEEVETWRNPAYSPGTNSFSPNVCQANYRIWEEYWWRYHPRSQMFKKAP